MYFDIDQLHTDILIQLSFKDQSQASLCIELDICRPSIWRLSQGHFPNLRTYIKLLEWLKKDPSTYIKNIKK